MKVNGVMISEDLLNQIKKHAPKVDHAKAFEVEILNVEQAREHLCNVIMDFGEAETLAIAELIAGLTLVKNTLTELSDVFPYLKPDSDE